MLNLGHPINLEQCKLKVTKITQGWAPLCKWYFGRLVVEWLKLQFRSFECWRPPSCQQSGWHPHHVLTLCCWRGPHGIFSIKEMTLEPLHDFIPLPHWGWRFSIVSRIDRSKSHLIPPKEEDAMKFVWSLEKVIQNGRRKEIFMVVGVACCNINHL